jgi:hypothetical protein
LAAGRSAGVDDVIMRFGPGVTEPPPTPGWTTRTSRPDRSVARRRRRGSLLGGLGTALVVAAVLGYLLAHKPAQLAVLGATVTAANPGRACDVTVDVVGTVRTNGQPGRITYQWARGDGETTGPLTQSVDAGATSTDVHLLWKLAGRGRYAAHATLRVIEPTPVQADGVFSYDCP